MSFVASVYAGDAFKEYLLPSLNNADYSLVLHREFFNIKNDVRVRLEIIDERWKILLDESYQIKKNKSAQFDRILRDGDILGVTTAFGEALTIIMKEVSAVFHSYDKFCLSCGTSISIGKDEDNDIVYDYQKMVSRQHAQIVVRENQCKLVSIGKNGTYVNAARVKGETVLAFGDYINILGLHMVYLGDVIAIDAKGSKATVRDTALRRLEEDGKPSDTDQKAQVSAGKILYHRAPRSYETPDTEEIEIEAPPALNKTKQQPLFMLIGPSVTMALPMLLGSMLMVYAANASGGSSGLYMYSGLIMSLSSAIIGVAWALANIRQQKKEEKEQEEYRFQRYSDYLMEKTDTIRKKYEETARMLLARYPSAAECLCYDEEKGTLWNRNRTHEDFLTHRLGIGDIPFQIPVRIPQKRFTLSKDELEEKPDYIKKNYEFLYGVPVTLDLLEHNLIGVVGGEGRTGAMEMVTALSMQIAANNCYTDVKLGYVYNKEADADQEKWEFVKWLPHVWSEDKKTRFVASDKEQVSDVFYELANTLRARLDEAAAFTSETKIPKPYYVIFISDVSALEGELFAKYVFSKEKELGLTTVLLTERYEELPNNCDFIIENTETFKGMYNVFDRAGKRQKIEFDKVSEKDVEKFTRHLSALQVMEVEEGGEIPASLTFFEMLEIQKPSDLPVKEYWAKNRIYENIKGMIGQKQGGVPCYLDVHEKYHGPHGLVAGTTGSGKSETLQTYILSLAVNYSPDDIGFFVIDYKGGGMANLFDGLPHLIGQISNLSGNQVRRAMISIKSENRRRQRIFTENGVNNINLYTKLYKNGEAAVPVPHLFIIIDEFAELKREEPEFMRELISVAQVGRSLGVHLVLATQKPSGTVDDNIWSNSKFRLCLRVQDRQDSMDMLHKPDAAYITQAGRCYLQVGSDEVYELFQSGYSGAIYDKDAMASSADIAKMLTLSGKVEMTGNSVKQIQKKKAESIWIENLISCFRTAKKECEEAGNVLEEDSLADAMYQAMERKKLDYAKSRYNTDRLKDFIRLYQRYEPQYLDHDNAAAQKIIECVGEEKIKLPQMKEKTQLDAMKEHLALVASENGYTYQQQLWMPVIPDHIYLDEFEEYRSEKFTDGRWKRREGAWELSVIIGKMDDPENQNQMPLTVDFSEEGHIAICGNIVSGKSTMMQTMVYALIQKYSPEMVNVYAIDFSSKMMRAFEEAPHVGGVMCENNLDKIGKFFHMLTGMLEERKGLFQGGNYSEYVKVNGVTLPAIVLFIDNYFSMKEKTGEAYEEILIQISKEGVSHGIFLVVNGVGFGMNDITLRVGENINTVLCLALQDKYAYRDLLHNSQIEMLPEAGVKGRGLAAYGKRVLEFQTALSIEADDDYMRMARMKENCQEMKEAWNGPCARKIPEIPEKPVWSEYIKLEEYQNSIKDRTHIPVGYNADSAEIFSISLKDTYCYAVYGGPHSGKTNFMRVCLQAVMDKDCEICVIDDPSHDFIGYSDSSRIRYVTDEQGIFDYFQELTPTFVERNKKKHELEAKGLEGEEIFDVMAEEEKPHFIFISDLTWFVPLIYNAELDMRGFLETIIEKGQYHNIFFLSSVSMEKRHMITGYQVYELFSGYKTGIHFGGKVSDNQVLNFDYLSFVEQGKAEKPGIGILPSSADEKAAKKVVVPLARK